MTLEVVSECKSFGGIVRKLRHKSQETKTVMQMNVFLPPASHRDGAACPVVYFLAGLTCTEDNVFVKGSVALRACAELGLILVAPDTSPRGLAEELRHVDEYDAGEGAGFYIDATTERYAPNYRMWSYITAELPAVVEAAGALGDGAHVAVGKRSIMGHSMGGHGALTAAFHFPERYRCVSAFAPICHPASPDCAWGVKAFGNYFGDENSEELRAAHDAVLLMKQKGPFPSLGEVLVHQGKEDTFLPQHQLQPEAFAAACLAAGQAHRVEMVDGDHGYYFVSTYLEEHLRFHAARFAE